MSLDNRSGTAAAAAVQQQKKPREHHYYYSPKSQRAKFESQFCCCRKTPGKRLGYVANRRGSAHRKTISAVRVPHAATPAPWRVHRHRHHRCHHRQVSIEMIWQNQIAKLPWES